MKILIFSWRDIKHPNSGGAEILTLELAKRWVTKGHQVTLISSRFPNSSAEEKVNGLKIIRPAPLFSRSGLDYLRYLLKIRRFYKKNLQKKYHLVIDQVHGLPFFTPLFVKEKIILFPFEVARKIWFYEIPFPASVLGFLCEKAYLLAFRHYPFLTISNSSAKELRQNGIKNVSIITPGISFKPLAKLHPKSAVPSLVSLGRITPMKRLEDTLQVFRLLHKQFPLINFYIIGRGQNNYLDRLKKLARQMNLSDRTFFSGYISESAKKKILEKAWALVSTSVKEGWGLIVTEAAAHGTPTVAYRVPGLVDSIKNNQTGLLCSQNTPASLFQNLNKILTQKKLRLSLSRQALVYSHQFSWDKCAQKALKIIETVSLSPNDKPLSKAPPPSSPQISPETAAGPQGPTSASFDHR